MPDRKCGTDVLQTIRTHKCAYLLAKEISDDEVIWRFMKIVRDMY